MRPLLWAVALVAALSACSESATPSADAAVDRGPDLGSDLAPLDLAPDSAPDALLPDALPPAASESAFIWQGFDHEWLRTVAGFRIPHRVSRFDSYLDGEQHQGSLPTGWQASASFHFAQGTGVDGNFMKPRGFYRVLRAPGLIVAHERVTIAVTDQISGDPPQARVVETRDVVFAPPREISIAEVFPTAVLRGFSLRSRCDDAKQPPSEPCNSDGLWPFHFAIDVGSCAVLPSLPPQIKCPLTFELSRAWTPNKGGLPGIAEKPLNERLDLELTVHLTALAVAHTTGAPPARFTRGATIAGAGKGHDASPYTAAASLVGASGGAYPHAVVGLTRFAFTLGPDDPTASAQQHLGRYIGALRFSARAGSYDPLSGAATVDARAQVWMPITVVQSKVAYELRPELIQLAAGDAVVGPPGAAEGTICQNSSPQAPIFSVWKKCGEPDKGPERVSDVATISAP